MQNTSMVLTLDFNGKKTQKQMMRYIGEWEVEPSFSGMYFSENLYMAGVTMLDASPLGSLSDLRSPLDGSLFGNLCDGRLQIQ